MFYNGFVCFMFVYGVFFNYQRVSSVFNVMMVFLVVVLVIFLCFVFKCVVSVVIGCIVKRFFSFVWKVWQFIVMCMGIVGVIVVGGVVVYMYCKKIIEGMCMVWSLIKEDVIQGYQQFVDVFGQGFVYVNRGNIGEFFVYLLDYFIFVGFLLKQNEFNC